MKVDEKTAPSPSAGDVPEPNKPPEIRGFEEDCVPANTDGTDGEEPPVRLELTTYALRKHRSAS